MLQYLLKHQSFTVFLISFLICFSFIGFYPIYILDEARNSEAAREMFVSGNYIVPFFNGELRTDKPPLHYFFMMLGYKLFGINAFGARFFSGVFGALTFLVAFTNVKRYLGIETAMITIGILTSSLFFVQEFHLAVPDPYLIFFIATALFSFIDFYKRKNPWSLLAMYSCIGFGALAKGPIAIALPGLIFLVFLITNKDLSVKTVLNFKPIIGAFLVLLIAVPWYYLVHVETNGEWTQGFFFDHNVSRFSSGKEGHDFLFFVTPLFVILGLLPFSVFIIQGFKNAWIKRKEDNFLWFAFVVSATTILFFSISSTKLPNYPMPCYPFVVVLIAAYLNGVFKKQSDSKFVKWSLIALLVTSVLLPIGGFIALSLEKQFYDIRFVSLFLIIATITALIGFYYFRKNDFKRSFITISGGWIVLGFVFFGVIYPVLNRKSPVTLAKQYLSEDAEAIVFKRFDSAFPINFNRTFQVYDGVEQINAYLKKNPKTLIITNTRKIEELEQLSHLELVLEQKALFENHTTRIYQLKTNLEGRKLKSN